MGARSLESFLFKEFQIVGVPPTQTIYPFDVLVKIESRINLSASAHLINLGCCLRYRRGPDHSSDLESDDAEEKFSYYKDLIKQGLEELDKDPYETNLDENLIFKVRIDDQVDIARTISTDSGLGAKVLQYFGGQLGRSKEMNYRLLKPAYQAIKDDVLHDLFLGKSFGMGLWKPDVEIIKRVHELGRKEKTGWEMWIVKERIYSSKFHANVTHKSLAGLSAGAPEIAPGIEVGVEARSKAIEGTKVNGPFLVGFRAVRLFYDGTGTLLEWSPAVKFRPRMRMRVPERVENYVLPTFSTFKNEFSNDPTHHMGGLFAQSSSQEDENTSFTVLDIETLELPSIEKPT